MNDQIYSRLIECLKDQVKIYGDLLNLVLNEKTFLIGAKIQDLSEINESKLAMIAKIQELEKIRVQLVDHLSDSLGLKKKGIRLLELASHLSETKSAELKGLHTALDLSVRRLKDSNLQNESLARAALKILKGSLDSLKGDISKNQTYEKKGKMDPGNLAGRLVSKEA